MSSLNCCLPFLSLPRSPVSHHSLIIYCLLLIAFFFTLLSFGCKVVVMVASAATTTAFTHSRRPFITAADAGPVPDYYYLHCCAVLSVSLSVCLRALLVHQFFSSVVCAYLIDTASLSASSPSLPLLLVGCARRPASPVLASFFFVLLFSSPDLS